MSSIKFIAAILEYSNLLVQSIANFCVMFERYRSFLRTNALLCCARYNWSLSELISNPEYFSFKCWHFIGLSDIHKISAGSLYDLALNSVGGGVQKLHPLVFLEYLICPSEISMVLRRSIKA